MSNRDGFFIDLSNFKDRSSSHLTEHEDGKYLVRVIDAELTETKKGDPMVNLFYVVVGGPHDGEPLIDRLTLTDKAAWRVVKVLRALGLKVEKRNMQIPFKQIVGRTLVVRVEDGEPYNGETRSEIREYFLASTWSGATAPAKTPEVETSGDGSLDDVQADVPAGDVREFPEADEFYPADSSDGVGIDVPGEGEVTL